MTSHLAEFGSLDASRRPYLQRGVNGPSLMEAQEQFIASGAMEVRLLRLVRPPRQDEPVDTGWHPIDLARDPVEHPPALGEHSSWPDDLTALYWWRPTFWRWRT